jgi:hypothetical protein
MNLNKLSRLIVIVLSIISIVFLATIMMSDAPDGGLIEPLFMLLISLYLLQFYWFYFILFKPIVQKRRVEKNFHGYRSFLGVIGDFICFADGTAVPLKEGGEVSSFASKMVSTGLKCILYISFCSLGFDVFHRI